MVRKTTAGSEVVAVDRRKSDRRQGEATEAQVRSIIAEEMKKSKVQRRRQIDPTTCERDYSEDEVEFMKALEKYKRSSGRMFPTCSEILEVVRGLGYIKMAQDVDSESTPEQDTILAPEQTIVEALEQIEKLARE